MAYSPPMGSAPPAIDDMLFASSKSAPAVNVWHVRKEQMARVQTGQALPNPSASTPALSQQLAPPGASSSPPLEGGVPHANGVSRASSQGDDPFVVRYHRIPPPAPMVTQALPAVTDPESWPEVGASLPTTPANGTYGGDGADKKDEALATNGARRSAWPPAICMTAHRNNES